MKPYKVFEAGPRKGQPRTYTDRVIRFLVECVGCREVHDTRTRKYRVFHEYANLSQYYVGKNGAVKKGRTLASSISLTDYMKPRIRLWEMKMYPMEKGAPQ